MQETETIRGCQIDPDRGLLSESRAEKIPRAQGYNVSITIGDEQHRSSVPLEWHQRK